MALHNRVNSQLLTIELVKSALTGPPGPQGGMVMVWVTLNRK